MKLALICLLGLLQTQAIFAYPLTPNPAQTKGAMCNEADRDFVGLRYKEQIPYCQRNVSWYQKAKIYDLYQIPLECRHRYTIDHFIPLAFGGSNSEVNLWPEHVNVKATRQHMETELYWALVRGEISQRTAVTRIKREKTKFKEIMFNDCDSRGGKQTRL